MNASFKYRTTLANLWQNKFTVMLFMGFISAGTFVEILLSDVL